MFEPECSLPGFARPNGCPIGSETTASGKTRPSRNPRFIAISTAWVLSLAPSLESMFFIWPFTVSSDMPRSAAAILFEDPLEILRSTSTSREVKSSIAICPAISAAISACTFRLPSCIARIVSINSVRSMLFNRYPAAPAFNALNDCASPVPPVPNEAAICHPKEGVTVARSLEQNRRMTGEGFRHAVAQGAAKSW